VFSWPGIGRVLVSAVQTSDYPLAQGAFVMIAVVLVTMNTLADFAYAVLDPRVSVGARR
jgi:peptide/nickel transport system permease protein